MQFGKEQSEQKGNHSQTPFLFKNPQKSSNTKEEN